MKKIIFSLILSVLFCSVGFSATLNMSVGETVTINAGEPTVVTCGATSLPPQDCEKAISERGITFRDCKKVDSALNCFEKHWHFFKREYPSCSILDCVAACLGAYPMGKGMAEYCVQTCSN